MSRLAGKVVLITGTGVGMGRAAASRFAAEGATVVGCDLNPTTSQETVRLVTAAGGAMTATAPVDLSSFDATETWIDEAAAISGGIDVLYNNASIPMVGPWDGLTIDDWHAGIRNELDLVFFACKAAWPHLVTRGGGSIINIASIASIRGAAFFQQAAHGAAKGGVLSFTYHLAAAGGPHRIRANAILPGLIRTPSTGVPVLVARRSRQHVGRRQSIGQGRRGRRCRQARRLPGVGRCLVHQRCRDSGGWRPIRHRVT